MGADLLFYTDVRSILMGFIGIQGVTQLSFGLMIPSLARLNTIKSFFEKGELKAHVDEIFDFDHIGDAFAFSKSGQVVGKIAIVPTYTM